MTEQTAFNIVKNHLLTQMTKSIEGNQCLYRGPNGTKCAIGALITDEEYKKIEDARCKDLGVYEVEDLQIVSLQGLTMNFLGELQIIHDQYEVTNWKNQLEVFAKKYNLQYE